MAGFFFFFKSYHTTADCIFLEVHLFNSKARYSSPKSFEQDPRQLGRSRGSEEGQFMRFAQALSRKCAPVLLYRANFTSQRQPPLSGKPSLVLVRPEF
jgi:hypothetical protein